MGVFIHAFEADGAEAGKVEVTGRIKINRPKAVLLVESDREAWLPKSKIRIGEEDLRGQVAVLMPKWLARKAKFI